MKLSPLFITAPSRSGSSLLVKMLNCTAQIVVVNEPLNAVNILDQANIKAIYNAIEQDLKCGFVKQRVDAMGFEVTDTFPPSKMKWGSINRSSDGVLAVGIKKSYPAFSNKDFFKPFLNEWPDFVKWFRQEMNGQVIAIIRDPRPTILSWKTTFDALKESTLNQCIAWNQISESILKSQNLGVQVIRYEDLILNPINAVGEIGKNLAIKLEFNATLPEVERFVLENYLRNKGISLDRAEAVFEIVRDICGETAKKFGY